MEYSRLIRIDEYLNIREEDLKKAGIYNGYIFLDSPLFLNPKLLNNNKIPEFYDAENIIVSHFEKTIMLLKSVKECSNKDVWWKMAKRHFYFPEPEEIGLGTSIDSIDGNGLTGKTAEKCLKTFKNIIDKDIEDSYMYRLLYLVQENIGVDRISDMLCTIIYENLLEFKLNTNDLIHGYVIQLEKYIHRYEATSAFYVIIKVVENQRIEKFWKEIKSYDRRKEVVVIDGFIYPSPSKL